MVRPTVLRFRLPESYYPGLVSHSDLTCLLYEFRLEHSYIDGLKLLGYVQRKWGGGEHSGEGMIE
jgi:hypothetical protein